MDERLTLADVKVLFVDDDKNIQSTMQRLLMDEDFGVLTAGSGEEGLTMLIQEKHVGLVVSDQRMPDMTGAQFLSRVKDLLPHISRIVLTGYTDVQAAIDAINKGGACRYLNKPWNDEKVVEVVREELKRYLLVYENKRLQGVINKQNELLQDWNNRLKSRVLEQTSELRAKNDELDKQNANLKKNFRATIEAFSNLIELRHKSMCNHAHNVANLSQAIAESLMLPEEVVDQIVEAALLHDIGKIGIPDQLLMKSEDDMKGAEITEYMQHAIRGQMAIDSIVELRPVGVMVRHHHEWYDGHGYPDGKAGDEIPIGARIIALADYADQTLGKNPTQSGIKNNFDKIRKFCGTRFDPQLFRHLEKPVYQYYGQVSDAQGELVGEILDPKELRINMILADDLYSPTGVLLLKNGTQLDLGRIESIHRYHRLDPFTGGVTVLVDEAKVEDEPA
jgi:response regulator RpfG family c-di-GMP phosphodiesterase